MGEVVPAFVMQKSVLVVDDHADTAEILSRMLERRGYRAAAATSGKEALARMAGEVPSVVVLDVMMPEMNGAELLREMRENPQLSDVPVMVFSADFSFDRMREMMDLGANDYVVKGTAGWDQVLRRIGECARASGPH